MLKKFFWPSNFKEKNLIEILFSYLRKKKQRSILLSTYEKRNTPKENISPSSFEFYFFLTTPKVVFSYPKVVR